MTQVVESLVHADSAHRSTRARSYRGLVAASMVLLDLVMFVTAAFVAEGLVYHTSALRPLGYQFLVASIVFVVLWMLLFYRIGLYQVSFAMTVRDEVYVVATALVLGIVPQFLLFTVIPTLAGSRAVLLLAAALAMVFVGGARATLHALHDRTAAVRPRSVAIVGSPDDVSTIAGDLDLAPASHVYALSDPVKTVPEVDELVERCEELSCDELVLASIPPETVMTRLTERAKARRIAVRIALAPLRAGSFRFAVERSGPQIMLAPRQLRVRTYSGRVLKRLFDIVVATVLLVIAAPVMLAAALAILVETGRPIFFRQRRIGLDGIPFEMLKFRSMHVAHGLGDGWATRRDPRVTPVGAILRRFSIDELPQLINVLRGEMSVVGPRPEMSTYVERFEREIPRYADRHLVKPGITGWSQLYMERVLTPDDVRNVLRHDLFYVEHWGVFMDLSIVAKTAFEFLFHRAA
jgi:exopolysaccharide biosynthesis polyprenyl glycosylphosphotransferase